MCFFDLETTGVNVSTDKIVEIAIVKIMPDGSKTVKRKLIHPEMPIPAVTTAVHGITDEMVSTAPTFADIAEEVLSYTKDCVFIAHNISFDYSIGNELHGDVFISVERVKENAVEFNATLEEELHRVMIHGILHFLGFKDKTTDDEKVMRKEENDALLFLNN